MYNRLCFTRDSDIADLKAFVKTGSDLPAIEESRKHLSSLARPPSSDLSKQFLARMQDTIECFGEVMPHQHDVHPDDRDKPEHLQRQRDRVYLPCGLVQNKIELVREYAAHNLLPSGLKDEMYAYLAYKMWKRHFWHVHIKEWIPFAICDECTGLFARLMAAKTEAEIDVIKNGRQDHRDRCSSYRKQHEVRMQLGELCPDIFLSIIVDGMDNQKTQLPRCEGKLQSKVRICCCCFMSMCTCLISSSAIRSCTTLESFLGRSFLEFLRMDMDFTEVGQCQDILVAAALPFQSYCVSFRLFGSAGFRQVSTLLLFYVL